MNESDYCLSILVTTHLEACEKVLFVGEGMDIFWN